MRRQAQRIQVVGGCSLPAPAVKNDHKLGGLKEYTLVFSQSGGQKSNNQCFWAKVKVLAEPVSSGGCKESPLSCLLELPESACTSWLLAIPHIPTTSSIPTSLHSSSNASQFPSYEDAGDYIGSIHIILNHRPISGS